MNDLNILVSGASVSGLSVAYWLVHHGFRVTIVERAPGLRPGGQALDIRGPALEVAERMGLLQTLRDRSTRLRGMSAVDGDGKEIYRTTERTVTGRLDSPDIEILRDDLCNELRSAIEGKVAFMFDDQIAAIAQDESGVDVTFVQAPARRFDLVIGADGLNSGVRRAAFGPDERFVRYLGTYIAVFAMPNFLDLDHWELFCQDSNSNGGMGGMMMATDRDRPARMYLGFGADSPLEYDYRDIDAQKRIVAEKYEGAGWEFPRILAYMQEATDFYFYPQNQVRMEDWSRGRAVLVGDAGYSVSVSSGQGTTVAMVGAYVLAGELAKSGGDLLRGIACYQNALRDYVDRNQALALQMGSGAPDAEGEDPFQSDAAPDFGQMTQPYALKDY